MVKSIFHSNGVILHNARNNNNNKNDEDEDESVA